MDLLAGLLFLLGFGLLLLTIASVVVNRSRAGMRTPPPALAS